MWSRHNGRQFDSEIQCAHTRKHIHTSARTLFSAAFNNWYCRYLPDGFLSWDSPATTPAYLSSVWACWHIKMYTQHPFQCKLWGGIGATDCDHPFDRFRLKGEHQRNRFDRLKGEHQRNRCLNVNLKLSPLSLSVFYSQMTMKITIHCNVGQDCVLSKYPFNSCWCEKKYPKCPKSSSMVWILVS